MQTYLMTTVGRVMMKETQLMTVTDMMGHDEEEEQRKCNEAAGERDPSFHAPAATMYCSLIKLILDMLVMCTCCSGEATDELAESSL